MTLLEWLFAMFVVLSIADGITTYQALKRPGTREANPVMDWLFDRFGVVQSLVATKAASIAAVWFYAGDEYWWILLPVNAFYAWVAVNNYRLYK